MAIIDSHIFDNTAGTGGVLYGQYDMTVKIHNSHMYSNTATGIGGALRLTGITSLEISGTKFYNNKGSSGIDHVINNQGGAVGFSNKTLVQYVC